MSDKEQSSVLISLLLPYLQKGNNPQVRLINYYLNGNSKETDFISCHLDLKDLQVVPYLSLSL